MTTSTDITALKGGTVATAEQAQRAVKAFRALQPTLTAYARNLTKNPRVRVEMAAADNGSTDGVRIFFRPPIALGADTKHTRSKCGRRDAESDLLCAACAARESVLVTIYHEIAHIAFESFSPVDSKDAAQVAADAALAAGGEWAKGVAEKIKNAHPAAVRSYMAVCNLVNPFMPLLWNSLEDARVNDAMFKARPGTKVMFDADTVKIFRNGVEQRDPATGEIVVKMWNEYPINMQILIGLFCVASGYDYKGWFAPQIERDLADPELREILRGMSTVRSAAGVYNLCFPILKRLRELGYCKTEDEREEQDESSGDSSSESGDGSPSPEADRSDRPSSDSGSGDSDPGEEGEGSDGPSEGDPAGTSGSGSDSEESVGSGDAGEDDGEPESGSVDEGAEADSDSDESGTGDSADSGAEGDSDGDPGGTGSDESGPGSEDGAESDSAGSELGSDEEGDSVDEGSAGAGAEAGNPSDREEEPDELGGDSEQAHGGDEEADSAGITGTGDVGEDQALGEGSGGDQDADSGGQDNEVGNDDTSDQLDEDGEPSEVGGDSSGTGSGDDLAGDGDRADKPSDPRSPGADEELIDTGADDGQGGTELIEDSANDETPLEYGTPEECKEGLLKFGDHEDKPKTAQEAANEKAVDTAIIQGLYFETPSRNIIGVREHRWGAPIIIDGFNFSQAWDEAGYYSIAYGRRSGRDSDTTIPESVLGPALLRMRVAFSDNQRGAHKAHLKSGRINGGVLGKRAHLGDPRLFRKKVMPGKKSYCVIIGMDISGSTVGTNIALEKRAVMAQAELCARMGISFAIYAHSGNYWATTGGRSGGMALDVYLVKEADEPWDDKTKERLTKLGPDSANLDGHFLEYLRKRADERSETDCVILYYSDGKMPAENHDEELEILQREIAYCAKKNYTLLGVGIRTDSPARHGLDTVRVDADEDISKVVKHLEKRLMLQMGR